LAAFLLAECAYGIWLGSDDAWNVAWWVTVVGVLVVNTLRRAPAVEQDARWWVWIVCTASTLRFLAFEYDENSRTAFWLVILFNLLADLALIGLGKSFSLLPARRTIRTGWLYRFVRHPAYAAYMLTDAVYLSQMPTPRNAAVVLVGIVLFACRARLEERLLCNDPAYREYMRRVRWRFLPGMY
jgi:protein-S-isoprenylcysteine O-methyltransferase Ste14